MKPLNTLQASEHNDCVVRALQLACGFSYDTAHSICKKNGRKDRKGAYLEFVYGHKGTSKRAITIKGRLLTYVTPAKGMTIQKFVKKNPTGRFICRKRGHAFCVIDGQVYNQPLDGSIITSFVRVKITDNAKDFKEQFRPRVPVPDPIPEPEPELVVDGRMVVNITRQALIDLVAKEEARLTIPLVLVGGDEFVINDNKIIREFDHLVIGRLKC